MSLSNVSIRKLELLGRLSSVTHDLEEIARNQGKEDPSAKKTLGRFRLSDPKNWNQTSLLSELALFVLRRSLITGRSALEIYSIGKQLGLTCKVKSEGELKALLGRAGIECLSIKGLSEGRVVVTIRSGITTSEIGPVKKPVCYFEAGLLAGLVERLRGKTTDFKESQCSAVSSKDVCRFVDTELYLAAGNDRPARGALSILPIDQYSEENIRLLTSLASHALTAIENTLLFEKARRQSVIDNLTGVYNHRYFQQSLRIEWKRAERHKQPVTLVMIDVDRFKEINDTYGHIKGDKVLKHIASLFVQNLRDIDVVSRYGGDEFALLLPQTDVKGAQVVAQRILKVIGKGEELGTTVSMGLAEKSKKFREPDDLIAAADKALLKAKKKGGGAFFVHPPDSASKSPKGKG